ncbi:MAG: glycosyltransferase [Bryobacteraceae bacterium]|nr:glycosyltransferase [Bryobacteraceae bacterium]
MNAIRILTLLEATTVSGSAKPVLVFARQAQLAPADLPRADLAVALFHRRGWPEENSFTAAARQAGLSLEFIRERGRFDLAVLRQLNELVERLRPDVLWTNAVKSHFLVRFAGLHRKACWLAFHHGYTATDLKMRLYNQLDRWSLRAAARVVTVCRPFAQDLERHGLPSARIRIQHMPVSPVDVRPDQASELRRHLGIAAGERVVLTVGRLSQEKGHADALRVFRLLRDRMPAQPLRLLIVGDGPERRRLGALADRLGLAHDVIFAGHQDQIASYYAAADVFLLASHSEGSPNVLLEAMSAGLPVVATRVGGVPELAEDGVEALLAGRGNHEALADAVLRVFTKPDLRSRLIENGRRKAAGHSPEWFYRSMMRIISETLEH